MGQGGFILGLQEFFVAVFDGLGIKDRSELLSRRHLCFLGNETFLSKYAFHLHCLGSWGVPLPAGWAL